MTATEQTLAEKIEQHHIDTITERLGVNRLAVEAGEEPPHKSAPTEAQGDSLRDLAQQAAILKLLAERVTAAQKDVRKRTQAALDAAAERDGVERITAELPSGEAVATIGLRKGETGPVVVDEAAFAQWVRATFPDEKWTEVQVARAVKPWKAAELLATMATLELSPGKTGARPAQWADPETGEVHEVPGVMVKPTRSRTHGITWRKGGKDATAAAWHTGALAHQLAAITSGEGDQ
ncbi:hypothetical protein [Streptomyces iconiensis]|uniref:Uncharacterized protein n=1 Tax=Streptomyces iconiensis TaxID=1384038 RepID=A0ABT6ZRQ2_9ACTN|nr:hypothetical protein [Streptomyces iconiensis]MDJ1131750.1 hypothetical protein [Streptomyces iconiensis]